MTWFKDMIDPADKARVQILTWYRLAFLKAKPTLAEGQNEDLKYECTDRNGIPLRFWVTRSTTIADRPQTAEGHYMCGANGSPNITVEAYLDGRWKLVAGYNGQ